MATRNMWKWNCAEYVLRDFFVERWNPHFLGDAKSGSVSLLLCNDMFILEQFIPVPLQQEFQTLLAEAGERLLYEVGFSFETDWKYKVMNQENICAMTEDLLRRIASYEAETGNNVKECVMQMLMRSEWKMPCVEKVEITFEFDYDKLKETFDN